MHAQSPSPEYLAERDRLNQVRNKPWAESTDSEKIDKLKMFVEEFKYLTNRIATLENEVRQFKKHSHKDNGDIVVPLSTEGSGGLNSISGIAMGNLLA